MRCEAINEILERIKLFGRDGERNGDGNDYVYMALQWLNRRPIIDGSKGFRNKMKCIDYIQEQPKLDIVEWTIARVEIVA